MGITRAVEKNTHGQRMKDTHIQLRRENRKKKREINSTYIAYLSSCHNSLVNFKCLFVLLMADQDIDHNAVCNNLNLRTNRKSTNEKALST
jgi:hypothetical protein